MCESSTVSVPLLLLCYFLVGPAAAAGMGNYGGQRYYIGFGTTKFTPTFQLSISTVESFPVSFEIMTLLGYSHQGTVLPNSTTRVIIPSSYEISSINDTNKGISITTDNGIIRVHGLNYSPWSSDGFLALPCTALDVDSYEYYALTYHDIYFSFLLIVGCEDSTVVNYGSNTVVLNKMETLFLDGILAISGTRVTSNKPVSFFSGHRCTLVPSDVVYCDHLVEQIPPTAVWGTHFMSASYFSRSSGELYRILTASNSTTVTVNCNTFSQPQTFNLTSAGSWREFMANDSSFCSIESNNPLLVMEFSLGREIDGVGDPFMMMIPSVDQYTNDYVFHSPSEFSNYITILVTPQYYQPEQILVDGVSQENANWAPVHCANDSVCGYCAYVTLEPGDHHVWHSDSCAKMSVLMYGFVTDGFPQQTSYGQPAGIFFESSLNFSYTMLEPHSVRFTWSPPPKQEQSEEITHYTLNCVSESGSEERIVHEVGLETTISTFAPATHYWCSISASTPCRGDGLYSDVVHLLTVPETVMNLTVWVADDEILILWTGLENVVSHYTVTVYQAGGMYHQFNTSQFKPHLIISKEIFSGGDQSITRIHVSGVNTAGIGQPAVVLSEMFERTGAGQSDKSIPTLMIIIGGTVAANIFFFITVVITSVIIVKKKQRHHGQKHSLQTNDNVAYGLTSRNVVETEIHQHNPNCSPTNTLHTNENVAYAFTSGNEVEAGIHQRGPNNCTPANTALELQSVSSNKDLVAPSGTVDKYTRDEGQVYDYI